jgi:hypothetical protein
MAVDVIVLTWVALLWPFLALRRWIDARDWPLWTDLSTRRAEAVRALASSVRVQLEIVEHACSQARQAHWGGSLSEAELLLRAAVAGVEIMAPGLSERLREWSLLSRGLLAAAPVLPLRARLLGLAHVRGLARAERVLHALAASSVERFRLHLVVLRLGLALVLRSMRSARVAPALQAWDRLTATLSDLSTLSNEAIESYRVLLVSIQSRLQQLRTAA